MVARMLFAFHDPLLPGAGSARSTFCALPAALVLLITGTHAQGPGYVIWQGGGATGGGVSVCGIGDVNADGTPDVATGNPYVTYPAGQARLRSGSDGSTLLTIAGPAGSLFGAHVASAGDVNGDSVNDLLIMAPGSPTGAVHLHSGATGTPIHTFSGPTATGVEFEGLGLSIAGVGDLDLDGIPDVLVLGQVFSGRTGLVLLDTASSPFAVVGPGDLNADGVPDLVLSTLGANVKVISGKEGLLLHVFLPSAGEEWFGSSLAVGHVNADGVPDVVVGSSKADVGASIDAGVVKVFSGNDWSLLKTFTGTGSSQQLGRSVAVVGDLNADNFGDVWVGGDFAAKLFSGRNGALLLTDNNYSSDSSPRVVAGVADVNGDGFPDLAVANEWEVVRVSTFAGIPLGTTPYGSGCPGSGGFEPSISTGGGQPSQLGNPAFMLLGSELLGGTTALLVAGSSFQSWSGVPLPLDLSFLGMPGCALLASADMLIPVKATGAGPGAGTVGASVPIPASPSVAGAIVHFQWFAIDPGPAILPGVMSRALQVLVL